MYAKSRSSSVNDSLSSFSALEPTASDFTPSLKIDDLNTGTLPKEHAGDTKPTFEEADKASGTSIDPLKWFGILVPPALRASQSSFKSAVVDVVPALASLSKQMGKLEVEVRRTRKRLRKLN